MRRPAQGTARAGFEVPRAWVGGRAVPGDPPDYTGPTRILQGDLAPQGRLLGDLHSFEARFPPLWGRVCSWVRARTWTFWGGVVLPGTGPCVLPRPLTRHLCAAPGGGCRALVQLQTRTCRERGGSLPPCQIPALSACPPPVSALTFWVSVLPPEATLLLMEHSGTSCHFPGMFASFCPCEWGGTLGRRTGWLSHGGGCSRTPPRRAPSPGPRPSPDRAPLCPRLQERPSPGGQLPLSCRHPGQPPPQPGRVTPSHPPQSQSPCRG